MITEKKLTDPHTMLDGLVYFTDCQVATFERAAARKSYPKNELWRQRHLAELMLRECIAFYASSDDTELLAARLREADKTCAAVHGSNKAEK